MKKSSIIVAVIGAAFTGAALAKPLPEAHVNVVGNLSTDAATIQYEKPFWTELIPNKSDGKITVDYKSFDLMGLKGPEVLRLMSKGVIEFGTATLSYFAADDAINDAVNLVGLAPSAKKERKIVSAFKPVYEKRFRQQKLKILGFGANPAQVLFCNTEIGGLKGIKNKKVRTSSRTQADFVEALDGVSVNMSFSEVVPALQTGVLDCAITGSLSGYNAKWYEVTTHLLKLPLNWNPLVYAVNLDTWEGLDPEVRSFIGKNMNNMIDNIWGSVVEQTEKGYACNSGTPKCNEEVQGNMTLVEPEQEDYQILNNVARNEVLPSWANRCSSECVQSFNERIGDIVGVTLNK